MIYVKVYDKYINKFLETIELSLNTNMLSLGDYITYTKDNVETTVKINKINHKFSFHGFENQYCRYDNTEIKATIVDRIEK